MREGVRGAAGVAGAGQLPAVGWGIVGTGTIAGHFAEDIGHARGAYLAAVSSRSVERAAAFTARHGGRPFGDIEALVREPAVQAVYIASPNATHFDMARAVMAAGKAVLVEKPLVCTAEDAERLAALAVQHGTFCMEGMWSRFLPVVDLAEEKIRSGSIGTVKRIRAELAFAHPYDPDSRFFDPAQGGGALLDLGVYLVSLSQALMGRPDRVQGGWRAAPSGVDMTAEIVLGFGAVEAHLACGFDRDGTNLFMIEGSRGTLVLQPHFISSRQLLAVGRIPAWGLSMLPGGSAPLRLFSKVAKRSWLPGVRRYDCAFDGYGLQFEIEAASRVVAQGQTASSVMPLADSIETLRIIEQVRARPPA
ncbi:oxidoreductase [Gluconacetobacter liquefaciens]|uniref:Gfo/Idh/MocA family oxidoreductase n=1 Tax=Gluconacetobacter liquefaciens TaxID=89584 RepID=A0A370G248_GLULI|nr:Gfo/Idh/MocA family oxidoreductase [Gluconacetobacter liquefaciens]MBB2186782.1 Gfo/Idh/MocA family oxidoreductase [Gluconacetobacter liquefaciens]RDI37802.1 putative dehydrogenase [Gluconacetobacter liquefaciens]GEB38904.1 oxidoreductase [Gluconacetobacter liquefaciens]